MGFSSRGKHARKRCHSDSDKAHSYGRPFGYRGVVISWCKNCNHYSYRTSKYDREIVNEAIAAFEAWRKEQEEVKEHGNQ